MKKKREKENPLANYTPPAEMPERLRKEVERRSPRKEYVIFRAGRTEVPDLCTGGTHKEECVDCVCTACGQRFRAEKIAYKFECASGAMNDGPARQFGVMIGSDHGNSSGISETQKSFCIQDGDSALCPICGAQTNWVHVSRCPIRECQFPSMVIRDGDVIAFVAYRYMTEVGKDGTKHVYINPHNALAFDAQDRKRTPVYFSGVDQFFSSCQFHSMWERRARASDPYGSIDEEVFVKPTKKMLAGTDFENCHLNEYVGKGDNGNAAPATYLYMWSKNPQIEALVTSGGNELLREIIKGSCYYQSGYYGSKWTLRAKPSGIDLKRKRPGEMLGLTREEYRRALAQGWNCGKIKTYLALKQILTSPSDDDVKCTPGAVSVREVIRLAAENGISAARLYRYAYGTGNQFYEWRDYIEMSKRLGELTDETRERFDFFPRDLKKAHDRCVERERERKDREKAKELEKLAEMFAERYEVLSALDYSFGGLMIRPARNGAEFVREGAELHHCVAGYAERHAKGMTAILFIRRESEPDRPYYTLELNESTLDVIQNRGMRNCERTEQVKEFEARWLEHIRGIRKNNKKEKKVS